MLAPAVHKCAFRDSLQGKVVLVVQRARPGEGLCRPGRIPEEGANTIRGINASAGSYCHIPGEDSFPLVEQASGPVNKNADFRGQLAIFRPGDMHRYALDVPVSKQFDHLAV